MSVPVRNDYLKVIIGQSHDIEMMLVCYYPLMPGPDIIRFQ